MRKKLFLNKNIISAIAALSMSVAIMTPAMADGISDAFANKNQARAGVYFRLPFAGGLKKTDKNQLNYGFAMGFGRTQSGLSFMDARRNFNTDVIKLNFNAKGFKSFNVGGQDIYRINRTRLGAVEGEMSSSKTWILYGIGVAAIGAVLLLGGKEYEPTKNCSGFMDSNGFCRID
jgi:hypothetical protein